MEVERTKPRGRLRKTGCDGIKEDMKRFGPGRMYSLGENGERKLRGHPANPGSRGGFFFSYACHLP